MTQRVLEPTDLAPAYSALRCRDRWLALQRLRAAAGVEAVLLIVGPDAQFSRGGEVAFNWLLGGLSGRSLLSASVDSKYEECFVCIRADRSTVFCKHGEWEEFAGLTSLWEGGAVIVPTRAEEAEQDAYDAKKTTAFLDAVAGCASIGVAMHASDEQGDLKMAVERWPLVQAHAYDEFGLGFLTLRSPVVNLEEHFQRCLYATWDYHAVVSAYSLLPPLKKAWDEAMQMRDEGERDGPSTAAPLVDYFEYGRLVLSDEDVGELRGEAAAELLNPAPRVLLGAAASAGIAQGVSHEALSDAVPAPPAQEPALHAVWEAVEPLTGIAVTRTYVLGGGGLLAAGGAAATAAAIEALLAACAAATACCRALLAPGGALAAAALLAPEARRAALSAAAAEVLGASPPGRLEVACMAMDTTGLPHGEGLGSSGVALLYVRVALSDVPAPGTGASLGTVAYGDSAFCAQLSPALEEAGRDCAVLTRQIPALAFWPSHGDAGSSESVKAGLDSCLGVGFDLGPSVALGHRSGVRVYLEDRGKPPDPLGLGETLDVQVRSALAVGIAGGDGAPIVATVNGTIWSFRSGKIVIDTPRTGFLLLEVQAQGPAMPSAEASEGLVWVPVAAPTGGCVGLRAAVAVTPSTAAEWRAHVQDAEGDDGAPRTEELAWLAGAPASRAMAAVPPPLAPGFAATCALAVAHGGAMGAPACQAVLAPAVAPEAPARCVWVTGLPGAGALDVAAALALALGAPAPIDLAALGAPGDDAGARLAQVVAPLVAQGSRLLVVCDVQLGPMEVLGRLARQRPLADICAISRIVSVLEPLVAYPWGTARHPLLLDRTRRAWVDAVVVQENRLRGAGSKHIAPRETEAFAGVLVKELSKARGSRESVLLRPPTLALAEGLAMAVAPSPPGTPAATPPGSARSGGWGAGDTDSAAVEARRALAFPQAGADNDVLAPRWRLQRVFVPTADAVPLDPSLLRSGCLDKLQLSRGAADAAGVWRGLFCVEFHVCGADLSELEDLDADELVPYCSSGAATSTAHSAVLAPAGELSPPQRRVAPLSAANGVVWWWVVPAVAGADMEQVLARGAYDVVEACRLRPPAQRPTRSAEDLSVDEVARAEESLMAAGPPDGWLFNGTCFVDFDGHEQRHHPGLPSRVQAMVAEHNAAVAAWNAAAAELAALPMFAAARATL